MNRVQHHRGPDGDGVFESAAGEVALGHVRLSILDLGTSAAQPMRSRNGRLVLVYNGELYNFRELRLELEARGHEFHSTGDTEVLLYGLQEHGEAFLDRLNGIYAFALWDTEMRELLLARDPFGVKPLYYAEPSPGTLLFASEMKALCAHPRLAREPDFEAILQHLTFGHASGDRTALRGVHRLDPGTVIRWRADTRTLHRRKFWKAKFVDADQRDSHVVSRALTVIEQAVSRQLVSDVPVGALLSGGLDSSVLTSLAARSRGKCPPCYTVVFPPVEEALDHAHSDAGYARSFARDMGGPLREVELTADVAFLWDKLVYHLDEPLSDPAAISCYLLCRLARRDGTPVLLSGQGADELLCGYPRYQAISAATALDRTPQRLRRGMAAAASWLPSGRSGKWGLALRRTRRVLEGLTLEPDARFLAYCAPTPATEAERVLSAGVRESLGQRHGTSQCLEFLRASKLTGIERYLARDQFIYLPNHNLLYTDKMGMASGVEVRVPFLDLELASLVNGLDARWKLRRGQTKVLLRSVGRGVVPDAIIDRPKAGFGAPFRHWLRDELAPLWSDLTAEDSIRRRGWFDPTAVQDARRRSLAGSDDLYMLQWSVLTVELWARHFIDRNPAAC
jgi:asparagine synthase (glutamine-hydrolysing)